MDYMKKTIWMIAVLTMMGCGSSSSVSELTPEEYQAFEDLVHNGNYEIRARWARPVSLNSLTALANAGLLAPEDTPSRINLLDNPGYLRVIGDSLSVYLPYYGDRQIGGGYNTLNNAIRFDGIPKKMELEKDEKSKGYRLKMTMDNNTETYTVAAKLAPNSFSTINVNSTHRSGISYSGDFQAYDTEK